MNLLDKQPKITVTKEFSFFFTYAALQKFFITSEHLPAVTITITLINGIYSIHNYSSNELNERQLLLLNAEVAKFVFEQEALENSQCKFPTQVG